MKFGIPLKKLLPKPPKPSEEKPAKVSAEPVQVRRFGIPLARILPQAKPIQREVKNREVNKAVNERKRRERELVAGGDILWKPVDRIAAKLLSRGHCNR